MGYVAHTEATATVQTENWDFGTIVLFTVVLVFPLLMKVDRAVLFILFSAGRKRSTHVQ